MTEPDVTLTDYGIALECAILAGLLYRCRSGRGDLRRPFVLFFASSALGALAGGAVHGFFLGDRSLAGAAPWRAGPSVPRPPPLPGVSASRAPAIPVPHRAH